MSQPQELILSASSEPSSSSSRPSTSSASSVHLHDLLTSAPVHSFKPSVSALHSVGYIQSSNGVGGGVFVLQEGKAIANVWTWQKDQVHLKLHLPERLSCFSVSPNGVWAAGGSPSGHLYLWEIASGLLHASFTVHYRLITSLVFSPDSRLLLTSSLDASSHVFLVSQLVDPSLPLPKPYGSFTDHTLPISSVTVSRTSTVAGGRAWTCSEDGTVKMWDLHPPFDLLCTFSLPQGSTPLQVVIDPMERFFYVAGSTATGGEVWHVPLFKHKDTLRSSGEMEAVGGGGVGEPGIKVGPCIYQSTAKITNMALSISATHLLVGTDTGDIHIFSLPSHQLTRTLSPHAGTITHLSTLLRPPDLGLSSGADKWPSIEVKPFERMRVGKTARDVQEITVSLRPTIQHDLLPSVRPKKAQVIGTVAGGAGARTNDHLADVIEENRRLRADLDRAIRINDKMWNGVVDLHLAKEAT